MSSHEAARAWGWHKTTVTCRCARGDVPGAHEDELGKWRVPFSESPPELPAYKLTEGEKREVARRAHAGENRTRLALGPRRADVHLNVSLRVRHPALQSTDGSQNLYRAQKPPVRLRLPIEVGLERGGRHPLSVAAGG